MIAESLNASLSSLYDVDYQSMLPRWGYALCGCTLFLIGFFGFFLNLLAMVLMIKDPKLWTPLNMILFNLVCSDFSVSVLGNPFAFIASLLHQWVFGETMCVLYGFFMALLGINSITTLTVLSYERYEMVSQPLSTRRLTSKRAALTIAGIWCYSLAVTSPPLFGWSNFVNEAANISCSVNWKEQTNNALTYILYLFALGQVLPVFIIFYSYISILITIKKNAARWGHKNKAEFRVTWMVFVMIMAFMVAWTPYSLVALTEQFAPHIVIPPAIGVIPAIFAKSSICYNPLIYIGMNTQFRASIKQRVGLQMKNDSLDQNQERYNTQISPAPLSASDTDTSNTKSIVSRSLNINSQIKEKISGVPQTNCRIINTILETENETLSGILMKEKSANEKTAHEDIHSNVNDYIETIDKKYGDGTNDEIFDYKLNSLEFKYFDDENSYTESTKINYLDKRKSGQCQLYADEDCDHFNIHLWNNDEYSDLHRQCSMEVYDHTKHHSQKILLTSKNKSVAKSRSLPLIMSNIKHSSFSDITQVNNVEGSRVFSFASDEVRERSVSEG